jgi:hypothetical protein
MPDGSVSDADELRALLRRRGYDVAARELRECVPARALAAWDVFGHTGRFVGAAGELIKAVQVLKRRPLSA